MGLNFVDRLLTVVVTATLTSAVWIVAGGTLFESAGGLSTMGAQAGENVGNTSETAEADLQQTREAAMVADKEQPVAPTRATAGNLIIPVAGIRPETLVDTFTQSRGGGARLHDAIDIMAPTGTPIVAAADGRIERLFLSEAGGKTIYIRTTDGRTIHYYAHLDTYAPGLSENASVRKGQTLGTVGATGNADPSAPHLHFAIMQTTPSAKWWEPSTAINPYPLLARR